MKLKSTLVVVTGLFASAMFTNAATMQVYNTVNGIGDMLYANNNGTLMNGGLVTMGYFAAGITQSQIDTVPELYAQLMLGNYTTVTSGAPGSYNSLLTGNFPGYIYQNAVTVLGSPVTTLTPLLGRDIYSIVTSSSSIGAVDGGSTFALVKVGLFMDDVPFEQAYVSDPNVGTVIIGTVNPAGHVGDPGGGEGTYSTLQMAIPETSSVLLGALGALGLLRRRR